MMKLSTQVNFANKLPSLITIFHIIYQNLSQPTPIKGSAKLEGSCAADVN